MSLVTLQNGRQLGDYLTPYVVAELNTSHFGNPEIAKKMIDEAKKAGCDCIKFQSWSTETLYSESFYKENAMAKRFVKKFSLDGAQLKELASYAANVEIDFTSTPYSMEEAEFLRTQCDVPFIKIASMELDNLSYLQQLAKIGVPLVLSTGMGTFEEIKEAVDAIESTGNNQLIILHCTSVYPASPEIIRLQNIVGLREQFYRYPIGYSDHSEGIEIPAASVALGACLIEKHFTLDSSRIGMDNQMAMEPAEMQDMIKACHRVHVSMGGVDRILIEEEQEQTLKMRRSMISKTKLQVGDVLAEDNIEFKRPGTGISPSKYKPYIGRIINKEIQPGAVLLEEDFS